MDQALPMVMELNQKIDAVAAAGLDVVQHVVQPRGGLLDVVPVQRRDEHPRQPIQHLVGVLVAGVLAGLLLGLKPGQLLALYWRTIKRVRISLMTIALMLALGFTTRYSGTDTTNPMPAKMFAIHRMRFSWRLLTNRSSRAPTSGVKRMSDRIGKLAALLTAAVLKLKSR
mgnify:CR=1 FL=1